jgi:hypothetical protein
MYFGADGVGDGMEWSWKCGTGCPLTSTPSEKRCPDAVVGEIGLNLIKLNSTDQMHFAAPGCLR